MIATYRFDNPLADRQSSPEMIAEALRRAIIEGLLSPGESLRQENLAKHFAVSRIPVREALRQLESEGWVELQRNRGARVTSVSAAEVREIYEIRAALEARALRVAAPMHTPATLEYAAKVLRASCANKDHSRFARFNWEFHLALYAPADRPRLLSMIDSLHAQGERYLRLKLDMPAHKRRSDDEHHQTFTALRDGNVDSAVQILEEHLLKTGELLANYLTQHLEKRPANRDARRLNRANAA
ncbi:MAG TPA: GntR family transcriptional regulator [Steroidobacteraceae bacterium]